MQSELSLWLSEKLSAVFLPLHSMASDSGWWIGFVSEYHKVSTIIAEFVVFVFLISLDTSTLICVVQFCQTGWYASSRELTKKYDPNTKMTTNMGVEMRWKRRNKFQSFSNAIDFIIRRQSSVLLVFRSSERTEKKKVIKTTKRPNNTHSQMN